MDCELGRTAQQGGLLLLPPEVLARVIASLGPVRGTLANLRLVCKQLSESVIPALSELYLDLTDKDPAGSVSLCGGTHLSQPPATPQHGSLAWSAALSTLKTLALVPFKCQEPQTQLLCSDHDIDLLRSISGLQQLALHGPEGSPGVINYLAVDKLARACPVLENLVLNYIRVLSSDCLLPLARLAPFLKSLQLGVTIAALPEGLAIPKACTSLTRLSLWSFTVNEQNCDAIAQLAMLTRLDAGALRGSATYTCTTSRGEGQCSDAAKQSPPFPATSTRLQLLSCRDDGLPKVPEASHPLHYVKHVAACAGASLKQLRVDVLDWGVEGQPGDAADEHNSWGMIWKSILGDNVTHVALNPTNKLKSPPLIKALLRRQDMQRLRDPGRKLGLQSLSMSVRYPIELQALGHAILVGSGDSSSSNAGSDAGDRFLLRRMSLDARALCQQRHPLPEVWAVCCHYAIASDAAHMSVALSCSHSFNCMVLLRAAAKLPSLKLLELEIRLPGGHHHDDGYEDRDEVEDMEAVSARIVRAWQEQEGQEVQQPEHDAAGYNAADVAASRVHLIAAAGQQAGPRPAAPLQMLALLGGPLLRAAAQAEHLELIAVSIELPPYQHPQHSTQPQQPHQPQQYRLLFDSLSRLATLPRLRTLILSVSLSLPLPPSVVQPAPTDASSASSASALRCLASARTSDAAWHGMWRPILADLAAALAAFGPGAAAAGKQQTVQIAVSLPAPPDRSFRVAPAAVADSAGQSQDDDDASPGRAVHRDQHEHDCDRDRAQDRDPDHEAAGPTATCGSSAAAAGAAVGQEQSLLQVLQLLMRQQALSSSPAPSSVPPLPPPYRGASSSAPAGVSLSSSRTTAAARATVLEVAATAAASPPPPPPPPSRYVELLDAHDPLVLRHLLVPHDCYRRKTTAAAQAQASNQQQNQVQDGSCCLVGYDSLLERQWAVLDTATCLALSTARRLLH